MKTKRPTKRPAKKREIISHFPAKDLRPIVITGSIVGAVVASDRTDSNWKATQIADSWRGSGLEVQIDTTAG